jgi:hypothetical protein
MNTAIAVTDEMAEAAARVLNKRLAERKGLHGVSRDMLEAALSAALTPHGEDAAAPAPQHHVEGARYAHVGFQWRARASADDLWSPWRDGPCPALAPKGSETEERRVYALAATATEGSAE